jgi:hypothetical protein
MAQIVECLTSKLEASSSNPSSTKKFLVLSLQIHNLVATNICRTYLWFVLVYMDMITLLCVNLEPIHISLNYISCPNEDSTKLICYDCPIYNQNMFFFANRGTYKHINHFHVRRYNIIFPLSLKIILFLSDPYSSFYTHFLKY